MKFSKLDANVARYINVDEYTFDALPESVQNAMVQMAMNIADKEQQMEKERQQVEEDRQKAAEERQRVLREVEEEKAQVEEEKAQIEEEKAYLLRQQQFFDIQLETDEFMMTLEEIGPTRSEAKVRHSIEYFELRKSLIEQAKAGKMEMNEVKYKLNDWVKNVLKEHEKLRKKNYRSHLKEKVVKEEKRREQKMHFVGSATREIRSDHYDESMDSVDYEGFKIFFPDKPSLEEYGKELVDQFKLKYQGMSNVYYTVQLSMRLVGANRFPTNTHLLVMDGNYDWYSEFLEMVYKRLEVVSSDERYEDPPEDLYTVVVISVTARQLKLVTSWYENGEVEPIIKFKDFSLFTANDKNVPCVKQCVEIFRPYDSSLPEDIEAQLSGMRVKIYVPRVNVPHLKWFSDLIEVKDSHPDELDLTNDCKKIARIIMHSDHVGVIVEIKPVSYKHLVTHTRIKESGEMPISHVSADVETFVRIGDTKLVPYLVCWKDFDKEKVLEEHGDGCIERFVDIIRNSYHDVIIYCWNGAAFDFQLFVGRMKKFSVEDEIYVRNGRIIFGELLLKRDNDEFCRVTLKDPCLFIPSSLSSAARDFGVLEKSEFPHDIVKDFYDLEKIVERWYVLRQEQYHVNDTESPKIKIFKTRSWKEFEETASSSTVLSKAIEYCSIDVVCCEGIWKRFVDVVKENFGFKIDRKMFTTPQIAFKMLKSMLPPKVLLHVPNRPDYDFIRQSIYGGRVVAKNGIYTSKKGLALLDFVSLYPTAMHRYEHPYGKYYVTNKIDWNRLGIYKVVLDGTEMTEEQIAKYPEMVPFRVNGKLEYGFRETWEGVYCTYDLRNAKEAGYKIEVKNGLEWPYKGRIFTKFIEKLFEMKKNNRGNAKGFVSKLGMNGSYGKFSQKPIDQDVIIVMKGDMQRKINEMERIDEEHVKMGGSIISIPKFYPIDEEWDKMVIEYEGEVMYPTQNAVFILAAARLIVGNMIKELKSKCPGLEILYSDTDSLLVNTDMILDSLIKKYIGKELGQLSDEIDKVEGARSHRAIILGPKMYHLTFSDPETGVDREYARFKGVPGRYRTHDLFEHLAADAKNIAKVEMEVIKRNIVRLDGVNILKEVKQIFKH